MATETPAGASRRPRTWLLLLLGAVLAAYLLTLMFSGSRTTTAVTTVNPRQQAGAQAQQPVDPAELDVRIEELQQPPSEAAEVERNPFRFQPKPPPPAPPPPPKQQVYVPPPPPPVPEGPPQPPPIGNVIKFIGIVDTGKGRIGAFSDCRYTFSGREGEIIEGRFRVVKIGVESAILEYADGRGRTTLPLNGQACVGR